MKQRLMKHLFVSASVKLCSYKVASGSLSPEVIILPVPRASQHGPLRQPALKNFFESSLNIKGCHEVNRITERTETAHVTKSTERTETALVTKSIE